MSTFNIVEDTEINLPKKAYLQGADKYFNGQRYSIVFINDKPYYRNTRTHKKLSHDVFIYFSGEKIERGDDIHHRDENTLNDSFENLEKKRHGIHTREHWSGKPNPGVAKWNTIHKKGNTYCKGRKFQKPFCWCGEPTLALNLCNHHYYKDYNSCRRAK